MPDGRLRFAGLITPGTIRRSGPMSRPMRRPAIYSSVSSSPTLLYQNHGTGAVYELTDTSKGGKPGVHGRADAALKDNWAFSLAYTFTNATQVDPFTSSVALIGLHGPADRQPE